MGRTNWSIPDKLILNLENGGRECKLLACLFFVLYTLCQNSQRVNMSKIIKVGFVSLGCPKNLVDSEIMLGYLKEARFAITNDPSEAEVIVINTCGFIDSAKEESINTILEMAEFKTSGKCRRLVATGCLVQRYKDQLLDEIPEIDAFIGLDELEDIVEACRNDDDDRARIISGMASKIYTAENFRLSSTGSFSRYLKISEGCDHQCAFCAIPLFRGKHRSRQIDDIIAEARSLTAAGAVELNLVAQDLSYYGRDISMENGLPLLLKELVKVDDVEWLRLQYTYPQGLTADLQKVMAEEPKCVPYLDIPLQHGSDKVLKSMKRPGTSVKSLEKIAELRRNIPGLAIRTSIIVGFPTETADDFKILKDFIREARFEHLGVFTYSHEEDTSGARDYEDIIPAEVKEQRQAEIMEIQQEISLENNERFLNEQVDCLVEGLHPDTDLLLSGRLATMAPEVDGTVIINDGQAAPGEIVKVEITEVHPYDLVGRLVENE